MKKSVLFSCVMIANILFAQVPVYVPSQGLKAWYNFSDTMDSSDNGNHLALLGSNFTLVADRYNQPFSACSFNGAQRLVNNNPNFQFYYNQDFSFSIWINGGNNIAFYSGSQNANNFI